MKPTLTLAFAVTLMVLSGITFPSNLFAQVGGQTAMGYRTTTGTVTITDNEGNARLVQGGIEYRSPLAQHVIVTTVIYIYFECTQASLEVEAFRCGNSIFFKTPSDGSSLGSVSESAAAAGMGDLGTLGGPDGSTYDWDLDGGYWDDDDWTYLEWWQEQEEEGNNTPSSNSSALFASASSLVRSHTPLEPLANGETGGCSISSASEGSASTYWIVALAALVLLALRLSSGKAKTNVA